MGGPTALVTVGIDSVTVHALLPLNSKHCRSPWSSILVAVLLKVLCSHCFTFENLRSVYRLLTIDCTRIVRQRKTKMPLRLLPLLLLRVQITSLEWLWVWHLAMLLQCKALVKIQLMLCKISPSSRCLQEWFNQVSISVHVVSLSVSTKRKWFMPANLHNVTFCCSLILSDTVAVSHSITPGKGQCPWIDPS